MRPSPPLMFASALAFLLLGQQTPRSANDGATGTIKGVVYDSLFTRGPLAGAEVSVSGVAFGAITDARGRVSHR